MNTARSVAYGWVVLCVAGGGAYYFAKRSINSDRAERAALAEQRRQQRDRPRTQEPAAPNATPARHGEPAPVDHATNNEIPRGKYEAQEPWRSRKGDRFS